MNARLRLVCASANPDKAREIAAILDGDGHRSADDSGRAVGSQPSRGLSSSTEKFSQPTMA